MPGQRIRSITFCIYNILYALPRFGGYSAALMQNTIYSPDRNTGTLGYLYYSHSVCSN
jgi:hypothetical protein